MRFDRKALAALAVTGAIAVGAMPAFAQDASETPSDTTTQEQTREDRRAEHEAEFAQALADELGLDVDDVTAALTTVREEMRAEHEAERLANLEARLDEAVAAGELTQEQADAILEAAEAGVWPGPGGRRGGHGGHGPGDRGPGGSGPGGFGPGPAADTTAA